MSMPKRKPLSDQPDRTPGLAGYLEQIKSAIDKQEWIKAKRIGEIALKKLPFFSYSHLDEYILYFQLGTAYHNLAEQSRSLDFLYKANLIASKYHLGPEKIAHITFRIATNLLIIKSINQALGQFQKVLQYYEEYGDETPPMDKQMYYRTLVNIGYCYLYKSDLSRLKEIVESKDFLPYSNLPGKIRLAHLHLKGEYYLATKDYHQAQLLFKECFLYCNLTQHNYMFLATQIHLATIDLLEERLDDAICLLKDVFRNANKLKINDLLCEAGHLLSKCYTLSGFPDNVRIIENRIKPILSKLDAVWLYEKIKEFDKLYQQLRGKPKPESKRIPKFLVQILKDRYAKSAGKYTIIGNSSTMREVYQLIEKIAPTDLPVLLQGETGTGKELIANAIHINSQRANNTYFPFNCGVLPETLIESHLFGHTKGAFTGAHEDKKGYIELTDGGTLFVDEIADMSPSMQQKLLRVLEEKLLWRVGASKPTTVDTRFVFASNQDIEQMVKNKLFREDLFYRINTIVVDLPPLRNRKDDIPLLIQHFLGKYSPKTQDAQHLTPDALRLLTSYPWPGNVRELENEIKRILVLYPDAKTITESMLSNPIQNYIPLVSLPSENNAKIKGLTDRFHKNLIIGALHNCNGNINQTAQYLGYSRRGLYKRMKQLKIALK